MFTVIIAGNLGKDPETRFTPSGQKVTNFNVAVNQRKGKEDVTVWVRVTVWGDRFDKFVSFLKKGSSVIVTGKMNPPTSYTDKEGRTQISLEITAEMMEFSPFGRSDKPQDGQQPAAASQSQAPAQGSFNEESQYAQAYGSYTGKSSSGSSEDELPF